MDVDDVPKTLLPPISLSQLSPMSSSLLEFEKTMRLASEDEDWPLRMSNAGSDKKKLQNVLRSILVYFFYAVSSQTALKKTLIDLSSFDTEKLIESLNDDEIEELKNTVQKGDWAGLIKHRMWLARFRRRYIVMRY
jgi:hypothetical protein